MTENEIQRAVFSHLRQRPSPGVFAFHPKNGSRDMRGRGAGIYTGLGVEPGIPDVIVIQGFPHENGSIETAVWALELKTEERRRKKQTEHERVQENCRARLARRGVKTGIAYGLDEAITWLEGCGLLKGAAQTQRRAKMVGDPEIGKPAEDEGPGDPNAPPMPPPNPPGAEQPGEAAETKASAR